jgi:sucrose-6-phosphatase
MLSIGQIRVIKIMLLALFVTDLDNTLVGNTATLIELNDRLKFCREAYGTRIVYITGRSYLLYDQLMSEQDLLIPDILVASVGTEIYGGSGSLDRLWSQKLMRRRRGKHRWDRDKIESIASCFTELLPQLDSEQRPFKISYTLPDRLASTVLSFLRESLYSQGFDVEIVYSGGQDLDILPYGAGKGKAMNFLQNRWNINSLQTIVCGDSGNDLSLFRAGLERGIIVGNARSELLDWHDRNPAPYRYLAEASYASGILEGLEHFGVLGAEGLA